MSMANELHYIGKRDETNFFVRVLKSVLPWKGDNAAEIFRKAILIGAAAVFVMSLHQLMEFFQGDEVSNEAIHSVQEIQPDFDTIQQVDPTANNQGSVGAPSADGSVVKGMSSMWNDLYKANGDTIGLISIDTLLNEKGEKIINYAVVKDPDDNEFYLHNGFYKQKSGYGWIFADYRNRISPDGNSDNIVIYGHNVRKYASMFTRLNEYKSGVDFLQKNPLITFSTIYDSSKVQWIIVGAFVTNAEAYQDNGKRFEYWNYINFNEDYPYDTFISEVKKRSWYTSDIDCSEDDEYLTLQTCSDEVTGFKYVVVARKVRIDDNVDALIASYKEKADEDIYFPAAWTRVYGNKKIYKGWDI
ncbi:MAG: class B sortase [Oscillospiraceae bacterium]